MSRLPPLNAVKAFEVAARVGGFAQAAAELGVSAAAVSQQVRNLEEFLGKQLFVRTGNRIALTDAGLAIYPQTARALNDIAAMTVRIVEGALRMRLVVSVPASLAETWLAPKLAELIEIFPQMAIDIRVEDDPVDLARQDIDLRISYGDYHYPGLRAVPLVHDEVLPVCAPEFWYKHGNHEFDLASIHESLFIHTNWGPNYASHPTWRDWFARSSSGVTGGTGPDPSRGRRVALSSLAVASARLGLGVALGQRVMARADLEAGRLIALSPTSLKLGHPYCAFVPDAKADRADIRRLLAILGNNAQND
ncbi:LysR substrate-binding domain-containing protein [Paraburkholderia acidisoli]|uniref:LysR family transcriptional regulator n=1 Tax=Paraburkholderia acidisoli TaxID=2571748 RepID=A0A7Z2GL06_9BURK|nr:LysR substrate-binding domain-containing protein [Paraburkholderia acidisoli]QGZ63430.1 LysR family transcriptional regulator [Paraburkholderia acidisoli]